LSRVLAYKDLEGGFIARLEMLYDVEFVREFQPGGILSQPMKNSSLDNA